MSETVTIDAVNIGGTIIPGGSAANVTIPANGRITVNANDAAAYIAAGARYIGDNSRVQTLVAAPIAATAGRLVASVALANGTLTIANQPDVARQGAVRLSPGTTATTAGNMAITYVSNNGVVTVDNISMAAPASTLVTTNTSKGIVSLTSVIVTGMAGGTSPLIQLSDTDSLSVMVDPGFAGFAKLTEYVNGVATSGATVSSSAASIAPTSVPNATKTYSFGYKYSAP